MIFLGAGMFFGAAWKIAVSDLIDRDIYTFDLIVLLVGLLIIRRSEFHLFNYIVISLLAVFAHYEMIGEGDIWLLGINALFLSPHQFIFMLFTAALFSWFYSLIFNDKYIPFGSFILLGFVAQMLL